ncbi:unnamed protein product, partial [Prorocentrum cordatum]
LSTLLGSGPVGEPGRFATARVAPPRPRGPDRPGTSGGASARRPPGAKGAGGRRGGWREARARCEKSAFDTRSSPGQEAGREEEAKRAGSCKGRGRRRRGEPLARGGRAPAAGLRRGATGRVELPPACSPPRCGAGASRLSRAP